MGHNVRVHREFYRLPQDSLEVTKVGKILFAVEKGIQKYQGKKLEDITELSDVEDDSEDEIVPPGEFPVITQNHDRRSGHGLSAPSRPTCS